MRFLRFACVAAALAICASSGCPFGYDRPSATTHKNVKTGIAADCARDAAKALDWDLVVADLKTLMASNQPDIYPADDMLDGTTSYGPFFIREAWHCAGSYRQTDGLGGCSGGRQRFNPELSWPDNTNLDKAKRLLLPIKLKHGVGLSWGDLMILAGKVAIEAGGFPFIPFCAGRPDDVDGAASTLLGPTPEQAAYIPCPVDGDCGAPFGATTIGLIYVNPNGFQGDWTSFVKTAELINRTFGTMSMNAEETVALIGGGHAFGKTHGPCLINASAFPSPAQDPANPWPINICGDKGTFTTGFEGYWTATPSKWSNAYFTSLTENTFDVEIAPGGNHQYASAAAAPNQMMLPSDIALMHDPVYESYARAFAANASYLTDVFAEAWYKLTTRDAGPATRCLDIKIGGKPQLPPPQPWQYPLPPPPSPPADFKAVEAVIAQVLYSTQSVAGGFDVDSVAGKGEYWGAQFIHLAFQCASTFRASDHNGGCNGARLRFPPQSGWVFNRGVDTVLGVLDAAVKRQFGASLTYADLIVLAAKVALADASGEAVFDFCGGRSDATEGYGGDFLAQSFNMSDARLPPLWKARAVGLAPEEYVALFGRPRSANQQLRMGYENATWGAESLNVLSNAYFNTLLSETWTAVGSAVGLQYRNSDATRWMTVSDLAILFDPDTKNIAENFASDNAYFLATFARAWKSLMNADRFDGPTGNLCP